MEQLETLPPAIWLRRSGTLYLLVNAAHIGSIGLLIGSIVPLDLRLLGLLKPGPLAVLAPVLARTAAAGLGLAVLTGAVLFSVQPMEYLGNRAFLVKMGLLAAAALNAWAVRRGQAWARVLDQGKAGAALRAQAGASLLLWLGCLVAGRWIGFL
ncbi:membrane protein [Achromobacter sp. RTa]|nr:membrane protein [Achromobacter sp. RTa]